MFFILGIIIGFILGFLIGSGNGFICGLWHSAKNNKQTSIKKELNHETKPITHKSHSKGICGNKTAS